MVRTEAGFDGEGSSAALKAGFGLANESQPGNVNGKVRVENFHRKDLTKVWSGSEASHAHKVVLPLRAWVCRMPTTPGGQSVVQLHFYLEEVTDYVPNTFEARIAS